MFDFFCCKNVWKSRFFTIFVPEITNYIVFMKRKIIAWVIGVGCWLISQNAFAQTPSALNKKEFAKHRVVESESADYRNHGTGS